MSTINSTANEISNYNWTQSMEANLIKNENDITNGDSAHKTYTYTYTPPKDIVEISEYGSQQQYRQRK